MSSGHLLVILTFNFVAGSPEVVLPRLADRQVIVMREDEAELCHELARELSAETGHHRVVVASCLDADAYPGGVP
jgi:hypothetical protein